MCNLIKGLLDSSNFLSDGNISDDVGVVLCFFIDDLVDEGVFDYSNFRLFDVGDWDVKDFIIFMEIFFSGDEDD